MCSQHSRIAELAYETWELEGKPEGKAVEHWLEAEVAINWTNCVAEDISSGDVRGIVAAIELMKNLSEKSTLRRGLSRILIRLE